MNSRRTAAAVTLILLAAGGFGMSLAVVTAKPVDLVGECVRAGDRLISEYPQLIATADTPFERRTECARAVTAGEIRNMADIEADTEYVHLLMRHGTVNS